MKKMILLIIILTSYNYYSYGQDSKIQSIFKMHLFLNTPKLDLIKNNFEKNDSLYSAFSKLITLKVNYLKMNSYYSYFKNFSFIELVIFDSKGTNNIMFNRSLSLDEDQVFAINVGKASRYVLAVNRDNDRSYRLYGFDSNDFLSLLTDFFEGSSKIKLKEFLKNFHVETLDFECLNEGLRANDRKKYPCLDRVNDIVMIP